ncbi:MAG: M42 family metallopeptidase [Coriobacteriales bacterium]|nr:M42 family metallopeptidase [Coriobacteriales bacterium]
MLKVKEIEFLNDLIAAPSPTGNEVACAQVIREYAKNIADEISTDIMGSVHAKLNASKTTERSVMLAGHIDEVGLIVTYINDEGHIYFQGLGGVDPGILPAMRCDIHTKKGDIKGVIGRIPIHMFRDEPNGGKDILPINELFIDTGLDPKKVKEIVTIGDSATLSFYFEQLEDNFAVSRAFDDKLGAFVAYRVLEELKRAKNLKVNYIAAATVQEEIGLRGGETSAFSINPEIGIAVEVTHATDYPRTDKKKYGNIICGEGPVIARGPNINPKLFDMLVKVAKDNKIPYQIEAAPRATGTDANKIQMTRGGKVAGLVSIPLRYMHTPSEVCSLNDVENTIKLMTKFILKLDDKINFTPGID